MACEAMWKDVMEKGMFLEYKTNLELLYISEECQARRTNLTIMFDSSSYFRSMTIPKTFVK